jgi:DNA primase
MSEQVLDILQPFLGNPKKHSPNSGQVSYDCPACAEEKGQPQGDGKGNLEVNYNKNVFKCWACHNYSDMSGSMFKLIGRYGGKDAIMKYKLLEPTLTQYYTKHREQVTLKLPEGYVRLTDCDPQMMKYSSAMYYLKQRGITDHMIDYYDIGYTNIGKYHDRVIIPSYDANGVLNYFVTRSFDKNIKPKYLNPDADKSIIIFNEGKINLDCTIYLVEGAFDHITIPNSIPLLGKYLSDKLMSFLLKANGYIVILLDSDAVDDTLVLYRKLNTGRLHGRIKLNVPPDGHDPSTIFQQYGKKGIKKLIEGSYSPSDSRIF